MHQFPVGLIARPTGEIDRQVYLVIQVRQVLFTSVSLGPRHQTCVTFVCAELSSADVFFPFRCADELRNTLVVHQACYSIHPRGKASDKLELFFPGLLCNRLSYLIPENPNSFIHTQRQWQKYGAQCFFSFSSLSCIHERVNRICKKL